MKVICDIETERLVNPTTVHCIVAIDVATLKVYKFRPWEMSKFKLFSEDVTEWIGHNFMDFDAPNLKRLLGVKCLNITDTLILSRLENPKRQGGHSLSNWGAIFKFPKDTFSEFETYTPELLSRCVQDVKITYYVWQYLTEYLKDYSPFCIKLEHQLQEILNRMKRNGFLYNWKGALELRDRLDTRYAELQRYISSEFPPEIFETIFTPKANRPDLGYKKGVPITKVRTVPFNIKSPKQVVTRLNEAGWSPTERTKGATKALVDYRYKRITKEEMLKKTKLGWKVSEKNLSTIPPDAPESTRSIGEYLMLASRLTKLDEALMAVEEDNCVHGTCIGTGASTHRASHYAPNMANQPGAASTWGEEIRRLWVVPEGSWMVGTDAASIQLRILAHLIGDKDYIDQVVDGDPHTLHKEALGDICKSRDISKTFFYAWVLGSGIANTARILGCTDAQAKQGMANFYERIPGLGILKKETIPVWAKQGWMYGLDGRRMTIASQHLALASALQGNEKSIMAVANVLWDREARKKRIIFKQLAFTHDDWICETETEEMAIELGAIQVNSLVKAGVILNVNCPLDGESKIGKDWYDVH